MRDGFLKLKFQSLPLYQDYLGFLEVDLLIS